MKTLTETDKPNVLTADEEQQQQLFPSSVDNHQENGSTIEQRNQSHFEMIHNQRSTVNQSISN